MNLTDASKFAAQLELEEPALAFDAAIITIQASHVWCALDPVEQSECVEHFLAKALHRNPYAYQHISEAPWRNRIDLSSWILSLTVNEVNGADIARLIRGALYDLKKPDEPGYIVDATIAQLAAMHVPEQGWRIKETYEKRHPTGMTDVMVFKSDENYVLLEVHMES